VDGVVYLWFIFLGIYLALINMLDLLFNLVGLRLYGFNVVELGVFNAIWTLTYIFSARTANYFADHGWFKKMQTISFTSITLMSITLLFALDMSSKPLFYISYCLHAITASYARISIFTSMLEYFDSSKWRAVNRGFIKRVLLFEGFSLLIVALAGFKTVINNIHYLLLMVIIVSLVSIKVIPQPMLMIERLLFSIERNLMRMLTPIRAGLSIGFQSIELPDKLSVFTEVFERGGVGVATILLCLIGLRISNEYMLTPLPYHMLAHDYMVESILIVYGFAKLLAPLLLLFIPTSTRSPGSLLSAILARLIASIALYSMITSLPLTIILLSVIFLVNSVLEAILYNLYIEATHGYKTGYYMLVNEFTGFTGSLTSGLIYMFYGVNAIIASIILTTMFFFLILRKI